MRTQGRGFPVCTHHYGQPQQGLWEEAPISTPPLECTLDLDRHNTGKKDSPALNWAERPLGTWWGCWALHFPAAGWLFPGLAVTEVFGSGQASSHSCCHPVKTREPGEKKLKRSSLSAAGDLSALRLPGVNTFMIEYICFSKCRIWATCCRTASCRCNMLLRCSSGLLEISSWNLTRCFFSLCS